MGRFRGLNEKANEFLITVEFNRRQPFAGKEVRNSKKTVDERIYKTGKEEKKK